ncbi:MAG: imidazole glycerol phosphate synthase subunit HisH [Anaerolineae bacterium]|nr:imidazole glycerol phosphate synthase subunit HisH [Anaerolineae bacterium]
MIAVIDYGASNLPSVMHALGHLGVNARVADTPDGLDGAQAIILPGVGAFGAGMAQVRARGFEAPVRAAAAEGTPLLGICLGMQFLFEGSEELGAHTGLGLLPGQVVRFPRDLGVKIPHMGWNQLHPARSSALLAGLPDGAYTYFVHSYICAPDDPADVLATTDYGMPFTSIVARDNVYGVQFHPEKSQAVGLRILQNFVDMVQGEGKAPR